MSLGSRRLGASFFVSLKERLWQSATAFAIARRGTVSDVISDPYAINRSVSALSAHVSSFVFGDLLTNLVNEISTLFDVTTIDISNHKSYFDTTTALKLSAADSFAIADGIISTVAICILDSVGVLE